MIRIGLRDAKAHFHRFVMSIIAIALGVSFVVGSFCFRSMLNDQVTQLMGTNSDHDVYVRGATEEQNDSSFATSGPISSGTSYNKIDTSLVTQIEQVKGIDNVSPPERTIGATLLDHDGNAVVTTGAPTLMISASSEHPWRAANFIAGSYATGEHEIALSQDAAKKAGLQVGDTTRLIVNGEPHTMKVSGIFTTQTAELGVVIILAQPALVNQLMQLQGEDTSKVDKIGVYGNRTTLLTVQKQHQLADRINKALPKDSKAHAVTGQSVRDEAAKSTQESLGFVQPLILIFAVIALFVGAFIIANTFTMIVRDSMRGYALLRSVGASPAQVFFSVVIQALILGVIGSVLGVLLGWGLIELIDWGLSKGGFPLSGSPTPSPTAVAVGFIVGVVVTVIGSAIPARTAATAPPIQAMNETMNPEKPVTARGWIGAGMVAFGALCWLLCWLLAAKKVSWAWLTTVGTGWLLGLGGVCTAGGVIVLAPALVTGAAKVLGWLPSLAFPVTGTLATRNISRTKRRTANTAAALFVGMAIVSCLSVLASSMRASVSDMIDDNLHADYVLVSAALSQSVSPKAVNDVKYTAGVGATTAVRTLPTVKLMQANEQFTAMAVDRELLNAMYPATHQEGDAAQAIEHGEIAVGRKVADSNGYAIGSTVEMESKNIGIDEAATKQAIAAYEQQVGEQVSVHRTGRYVA